MGADEAFRSFDFEADPRWQQYWSSLELPAGVDETRALNKYKAKWYSRIIDSNYDADTATSSSQGATGEQPPPASSRGPASNGQAPEANTGPAPAQAAQSRSQPRPQPTGGTPGDAQNGPGSLLRRVRSLLGTSSPQLVLFSMHALLLVLAALHLQPLRPRLSFSAWTWFLQLAVLKYGYKVYLKAGLPKLRPFPAAIKGYMQQVAATTDFQYALMNMLFLPQRPMMLVLFPTVVLSTYHAFAFAASHFGRTAFWQAYGSRAHAWLFSQQQNAIMYNAAAEIGVGFLAIINVFSNIRNIIFVWLYWNFLRMRYFTPDASTYHRLVWSQLEQKTAPVFQAVPMLRIPLGYAQRWFVSLAQPAGR